MIFNNFSFFDILTFPRRIAAAVQDFEVPAWFLLMACLRHARARVTHRMNEWLYS